MIFCIFSSFEPNKSWKKLLDKDLSQWENYLSYRHKDDYNGSLPKDENGNIVQPVGYNKDETKVFSIVEENGEPVLRVSGEIYGCLFTKQVFENYHFKLKVKWGQVKWIPRLTKLKDSGILYHSQGESGKDYWRAWMLSQEFQIMEGHIGDFWTIANSAIDVRAFIPEGNMNTVAGNDQPFIPVGAGTVNPGFCLRTANYESANNDWTSIELICFNGKSLHIVNGKVVMVLANSRCRDGNRDIPLTKGKIQIQSEAAEVFYKDIQIKQLDNLPAKFQSYFK
ncbi:MAG TPA: DUF1080 domain-containing protein [Segetibacter sp.]